MAASDQARGPLGSRERLRFLRSFLAGPRQVGSVVPTSQHTARAMIALAPVAHARLVVELGAGTGPLTRPLAASLGPDARLLAFEIDPALAGTLAAQVTDPRVEVHADSAAHLEAYLDGQRPDIVFSALPFTSLPQAVRAEVLAVARRVLADDGVMVVLQYSPFLERDLRGLFASVERRFSPLNVPPALLYACRPGDPAATPHGAG